MKNIILKAKQFIRRKGQRLRVNIERDYGGKDHPINFIGLMVDLAQGLDHSKVRLLQIGANDGVTNDPVRPIAKRENVELLLVEPIPEQFNLLRQNYSEFKNVNFENIAIGKSDGELTLYQWNPGAIDTFSSKFTSFDKKIVANLCKQHTLDAGRIEEIRVPQRSITTLLQECAFESPDVVVIDAEGMDGEIVHGVLAACAPRAIFFEMIHVHPDSLHQVFSALKENGYRYWPVGRDAVCIKS